jgi:hypothetical protein
LIRFVLPFFSCCRSRYFRGAAGVLDRDPLDGDPMPVVAGGVVPTGACTVLPPGAASGMELRGCGDGA